MYPFTYHRARDVEDARTRLAADPQAQLLAGGMTLLPSMKHRLAAPSSLIDIGRIQALQTITADETSITIGAGARHQQVADDAAIAQVVPAIAALAAGIGDPQVRGRGTLGGSVANADPAADWPAAVLGLNAMIRTDRRDIGAADFFTGMFATALQPGEIITAIRFQRPRRAAYAKHRHPASGYAMAGVFVAEHADGAVQVAVTGASPCVFRWLDAERALSSRFSTASLAGIQPQADGMNADLHAPAEFRAHLTHVMALRAVASLTGEAS